MLPFVLTSDEIDNYFVRYLGRQNADEIPCYVFAVKPKKMEQGKRYFQGQIWVDDRDLMIVKTYGRSTGIIKKGTDQRSRSSRRIASRSTASTGSRSTRSRTASCTSRKAATFA